MVPNVRQERDLSQVRPPRWNPFRNFWPMRERGAPGAVQPSGSLPGTVSMLPHRVTSYRRPAFWSPVVHFVRREYVAPPPNLPGTAIPYTLFHPVYSPGQQGYMNTLPWNFGWAWGKHSFAKWDSIGYLNAHPVQLQNAWKPVMKVPQGAGTGRVWRQPRPDYTPPVINPGSR
jgi:hypothetical protein